MQPNTMRTLVTQARVGRLATVSATGQPHLVPVCFALLDEVVYSAIDHKPKTTLRLRRLTNLHATGRACVLVDTYQEDWSTLWWVRLDGHGRVLEQGDEADRARAALVSKYSQYNDHPPAGPVVAVTITGWSGWSAKDGAAVSIDRQRSEDDHDADAPG